MADMSVFHLDIRMWMVTLQSGYHAAEEFCQIKPSISFVRENTSISFIVWK